MSILRNRYVIIGFFLVLAGAILPFMILAGILESTYWLNCVAYVTSTLGIFLSVIGVAMHVGAERSKDDWYR